MFSTALLVCAGLALRATAQCTRSMLQEATAGYLEALAAGDPGVPALAEGAIEYEENDAAMDISEGVLSEGITIAFNRSIYDTTACASYTEVVATAGHPYVIGTRLTLADDKITKIESVVCDSGDWLFDAAGSLTYNNREAWTPIPEAQRDTREVLQAAADAYIDAWGDESVSPPFASPCARLEGGFYISGNCLLNFGQAMDIPTRRYTIDEELGAVDVFHNFPFLDMSIPRDPGTQTNNLVRVEGGKIRFIHENTVCASPGCGRSRR
ncbi:hypothetical protein F4778DRAFT_727474 [Xylariomycetidae sp. FL2044]|nr:hypothetical protein F4778DRAFT_727474 [Xylariomycetidae sp. FL2044]